MERKGEVSIFKGIILGVAFGFLLNAVLFFAYGKYIGGSLLATASLLLFSAKLSYEHEMKKYKKERR